MTTNTITRAEHMRRYGPGTDAENHAHHRAYYAQLVDDRTIAYVVARIGADRITASTDPHMNDIPLNEWDRLTHSLPCAMKFSDLDDYPTLAGLVCVAKEAARQYTER